MFALPSPTKHCYCIVEYYVLFFEKQSNYILQLFYFWSQCEKWFQKKLGAEIYDLLKQVHTTLISCSKETVIFAGIVLLWLYTGRILRSGAFSVTCLINLTIAISFSGCCAFPGVSLTVLSVDDLLTILPLTTGFVMMAIVTSTKTWTWTWT